MKGTHGKSRQSSERDKQDLGHMPLLESVGVVLWGSQTRARLVISNSKKSFGKFHGGLI